MACGKPIVASRVGGIPEVLKDSDFGILVEPRNPDSLASGVLSGLNRVWNPQRFIQRAQANTWREKTRQIFEEVYLAVEHKRIL
jgi:glycosyltransferase involved in cell wall biosynthesis